MNQPQERHFPTSSQSQPPSSIMSVNRIMDHPVSRQLPQPATRRSSNEPPKFEAVFDGRKYSLEIGQQPSRARMCGFGDKDRRPITPPPCVRLRVTDAATGRPIDINDIDVSYFILSVDLWSADGQTEANLVRHSSTSPSISAATATSYPPEPPSVAYAPNVPVMGSQFYPGYEAAQPNYSGAPYPNQRQTELTRHMQAAQAAAREDAMRIQHEQQRLQNKGHHHTLPKPGTGTSSGPSMHPTTPTYMQGAGTAASPASMYQPGQPYPPQSLLGPGSIGGNFSDPRSQPGGMFTRNLIGNLAVSAFRLAYPENDLGIWFVLQDLSVRTEGHFRLKLTFVDVGVHAATQGSSDSKSIAGHSTDKNLLQPGKLNTGQAPVLAQCFSQEFQVFSAKKFPGVVDSTDLSKAFAKQGIKIPIRKDGGGRGNERREWGDGDD